MTLHPQRGKARKLCFIWHKDRGSVRDPKPGSPYFRLEEIQIDALFFFGAGD
jgi:hypothetical protein